MAPTVVNAGPIQPIVGQEVLVATLAGGPFDDVDVYIAGGTSTTGGPSPELIFRLYQTIGGTSYLVEEAGYAANGANGALLSWPQPIGSSLPGKPGQTTPTVHAGGTGFVLNVFTPNPTGTPQPNPNTISATIAGVDANDVAADTNTTATVLVPASGSIQVTTAAGFVPFADVGAALLGLPTGCLWRIFANCGPGSVEAQVTTGASGPGGNNRNNVIRAAALPVATQYRLTVEQSPSTGVAFNATSGLSTYVASSGGGGGGAIILAGNANGPSNLNTEEDFGIEAVDRDVLVAEFTGVGGQWYVGVSGLGADRTINIPAMLSGSKVTIKDEDGSLGAHNIIVAPAGGKTIDGAASYTMTQAQNGLKGSITIEQNFNAPTEWALV